MQRYAVARTAEGEIGFAPITAQVTPFGLAGPARDIAGALEAIRRLGAPGLSRAQDDRLSLSARMNGAERRRLIRLPFAAAAELTVDGAVHAVRTRDIGAGGLLIERPADFITAQNRRCLIRIPELGEADGAIVSIGFSTISVSFAGEEGGLHDALPALIARLSLRNVAALAQVTRMASEIEDALNAALEARRIDPTALFAEPTVPLPGSDPPQFDHPARAGFAAELAPVLARFFRPDRDVAYAVAVSRHGYVPVHNAPFALQQRPGEPVYNHNLSRHARIHDDMWTACAARVAPTPFVSVEERDVAPRYGQLVRAVSAPVTVMNRRWGAARMAWLMSDDLGAVSSSAGCAEPSPA